MRKDWVLTPEGFNALLAWLDPDRELAAQKYETIRSRLIRIFACRGCLDAEDLADETINRVTSKLQEIRQTFTGEPARYFYGVANKVHLEYLRRKPSPTLPEPQTQSEESELRFTCLDRCMSKLPAEHRGLLLSFFQEEKHAKIEHRKVLAEKLGITANALRIRVHRMRASLYACVKQCLEQATA
jgi:RNA polymerase sigma factor (sigma-70 family)